jgi:hypothetical protein
MQRCGDLQELSGCWLSIAAFEMANSRLVKSGKSRQLKLRGSARRSRDPNSLTNMHEITPKKKKDSRSAFRCLL